MNFTWRPVKATRLTPGYGCHLQDLIADWADSVKQNNARAMFCRHNLTTTAHWSNTAPHYRHRAALMRP